MEQRLWDRRTLASALLSVLIAGGITATVCAAQRPTDATVPASAVSAVQSHTETCEG